MKGENNVRHISSTFIFVFNKDFSKILLIKRNEAKRIRWGFEWGIIGGKFEEGENEIQAGIREAKEEIGINLKPKQLKVVFIKPIKDITHYFFAININENSKIKINNEADEYKWFSLHKLPKSMTDRPEDVIKAARIMSERYG